MAVLPMELIALILSHLRVKSLLRLKTMSKEWYSLISSPYFANLHRDNHHRSDDCFLIASPYGGESSRLLERRALDSDLSITTRFSLPRALDTIKYNAVGVVGSCHGLVVFELVYDDDQSESESEDEYHLLMWNPSTNNYMVLPPADCLDYQFYNPYLGFGYDKSTNDYKLVMFDYMSDEDGQTYCQRVYSSNQNSWGPPSIVNHGDIKSDYPVVVDDHIFHWYFRNKDGTGELWGFDICTEEWLKPELPLPDFSELPISSRGLIYELVVLDGRPCLVGYDERKVHVCVMKEYGDKNFWPEHLGLLDSGGILQRLDGPPIAYCDGQLLIEIPKSLLHDIDAYFWYNLKEKSMKPITGLSASTSTLTLCTETLVPVPVTAKDGVSGSFKREFTKAMMEDGDL